MGPSSWFKVGSSSATVPDLASETNDLDPVDFWGARALYVDFHGFRVLGECIPHLKAIYNSCADLMQGFLFT